MSPIQSSAEDGNLNLTATNKLFLQSQLTSHFTTQNTYKAQFLRSSSHQTAISSFIATDQKNLKSQLATHFTTPNNHRAQLLRISPQ